MMKSRPVSASGFSAAGFVVALQFFTLGFAPPVLAGVEEGRAKSQTCVACHGPGGNSAIPAIPSLSGQPKQFIVSALFQFREGKRKNDQMSPMAASLSNADMNDLAAYFSAQPVVQEPGKAVASNVAEGKRLSVQNNCVACHTANLMGQQHIPRLAGQRRDYLREQLRSFKASTRGELDGVMTSAAQPLSEPDIEVLADYLSSLPVSP
jgi:cytochrome c553